MDELRKSRPGRREHYSSETGAELNKGRWPYHSDLFASVLNLDSASAFLIVLDARSMIIHLNDSFREFSSFSNQETVGRSLCDALVAREDRERVYDHLYKASQNRSPQKFVAKFIYRNGTTHTLNCSLISLIDRRGDVEFMVLLGIELDTGKERRDSFETSSDNQAETSNLKNS